ncbi:unnamed protein product [Mycena citricolor]|uniref:Uncharacterized protein n=1 Tax=Mycena citricolor TaxID=2018698 RepID=A0AAD2HDC5_9AGAR|nr:unnamed protein product [Mycena citricolor]
MVVLLPNVVVLRRSLTSRWPPANRTILIFCLEIASSPRLNQSIGMKLSTSTPLWGNGRAFCRKAKRVITAAPGSVLNLLMI